MTEKGPGKHFRKGITLNQIFQMFPDAAAEEWFLGFHWPGGVHCPISGTDNIYINAKHKTMPYRCRNYKTCDKKFSAKTNSVMGRSNPGHQILAIATNLLTTRLKTGSSMKLHRDFGGLKKTSRHLAHRLRSTFEQEDQNYNGIVGADETCVGGLEKNKLADINFTRVVEQSAKSLFLA